MRMLVLGVNWLWHDTAAAVVADGELVAMAEEERFCRVKHAWDRLPKLSVRACLKLAGVSAHDVDCLAIGWDLNKLDVWSPEVERSVLKQLLGFEHGPEIILVPHHLSHAAAAFYASGMEAAGVLVVDGSGESESISIYSASRSSGFKKHMELDRSHSLGLMYSGASECLGFGQLDAGKTMGLSSYGWKRAEILEDFFCNSDSLVGPTADFFGLAHDADDLEFIAGWRRYFEERFGDINGSRASLHQSTSAVALASMVQSTVEEAYRLLIAETRGVTGLEAVNVSGGVALNCVANGLVDEPVFIPPFPHDSGVAAGAAWYVSPPTRQSRLTDACLGVYPGQISVPEHLDAKVLTGAREIAERLARGEIGAICAGRAEVGPRALGNRSILAVPDTVGVRDRVNDIKSRERWRPFAPIGLRDTSIAYWTQQGSRADFMIGNSTVTHRGRREIPAVVHVDGTTRPQVVDRIGFVGSVLEEFEELGIPPVVLNTSYNGPGEPIVNTGSDAIGSFEVMSGLDFLVVNDLVLSRRR